MTANPSRPGVLIAVALAAGALGLAVGAVAADNLALHRPYVCSDTILAGWTGLTDGVTDSDEAPGCFATGGSGQFPKSVIVDLGAVCTISKISLYNSTNGNTKHVALSVSRDAQDFEQLREYYFPANGVQTLVHSFTPRQARYVKIVLYDSWGNGAQGPNVLFLRELQVYGDLPGGGVSANGNGREELRLARSQPALVTTPAVSVYRRYGPAAKGNLRIGVLGDSLAGITEQDTRPWPEALAALLEEGGAKVTLLNLAAVKQKPEDGATLLPALEGDGPPDVVILAYGRDAALAGADLTAFRSAWQALAEKVQQSIPALVVVVTPPPLLDPAGKSLPAMLPWALAEEQVAAQEGLPLVRGGSVLAAAPDPIACYGPGGGLSEAGKSLLAKAVRRLVWGEKAGR
jgi:hypothetical protein